MFTFSHFRDFTIEMCNSVYVCQFHNADGVVFIFVVLLV